MATRETSPVRWAGFFINCWAVAFALGCAVIGDKVTSTQWKYLMSIPGGKWTWAIVFAASGVLGLCGLVRKRYGLTVIGAGGVGFSCLGIAVFYIMAPFFLDNLLTLGFMPWLGFGGVAIGVGAMNRNDREW